MSNTNDTIKWTDSSNWHPCSETLAEQGVLITAAEAIDEEIARLNERARLMIELLKKDALAAAHDFQYIANCTGLKEMISSTPDMHRVTSVMAWQDRLNEIQQQHEALEKLRARYVPEPSPR